MDMYGFCRDFLRIENTGDRVMGISISIASSRRIVAQLDSVRSCDEWVGYTFISHIAKSCEQRN